MYIRPGLKNLYDNSEYIKNAIESNRSANMRFCANNVYLLGLVGKSVYRQCKEILEGTGFRLGQGVHSALKRGKFPAINTAILFIISQYWGLCAGDMLYRDLKAEGYVPTKWGVY